MNRFRITASDGAQVSAYSWLPEGNLTASIQIAHGMGEHAQRYEHVANRLVEAGYGVFANDHRGHGATAPTGELGYMGPDGWNRVLADTYELHLHIERTAPDARRVLLGHSMGASLAQLYAVRYGAVLDALVLSGSPGFGRGLRPWIGALVARVEALRLGANRESTLLQNMLFGGANKPFDGPNATGYEWLSRDAEQVSKYADDPLCGFVLKPQSLCDYMSGGRVAANKEAIARIPGALPIYVFSGKDDPVHNEEANLNALVGAYRDAGLKVDYELYPGGRHEMFNETNREEVIDHLIDWLSKALR